MRRVPLAGLMCRGILPKMVGACLADSLLDLPHRWPDKVRAVVLGICLARSTVLQDIVRALGGPVKKSEKALSEFLGFQTLDLTAGAHRHAVKMLRRLGLRRFHRYRGKVILLIDSTTYAKLRSRGKQRGMPRIGKVRLQNVKARETILLPEYTELWTGLLLKDKSCLGITRRLYTEVTLPGQGFSQNALEEVEIRRAVALVKGAFGVGVILVADQGFKRKNLLAWLKKEERIAFVIRIGGKLTVKARGWEGLLNDLAPHWRERLRRHWRDDHKDPILSEVRGQAVEIPLDEKGAEWVRVNVAHLTPVNREGMDPMILATTLPIETRDELSRIVSLYSSRWTIETFFLTFKESLGAGRFRVFSCWNALDRLLAMAHMALLVLFWLYVEGQAAKCGAMAAFWRRMGDLLREWTARTPELTLGQFFDVLALDHPSPRWARACT